MGGKKKGKKKKKKGDKEVPLAFIIRSPIQMIGSSLWMVLLWRRK